MEARWWEWVSVRPGEGQEGLIHHPSFSQALQPPQASVASPLRSCLLPLWSRLLAQAVPYLRDLCLTKPTPPQQAPLTPPRARLLSPLGTRSLGRENQLQLPPAPPRTPSRISKH